MKNRSQPTFFLVFACGLSILLPGCESREEKLQKLEGELKRLLLPERERAQKELASYEKSALPKIEEITVKQWKSGRSPLYIDSVFSDKFSAIANAATVNLLKLATPIIDRQKKGGEFWNYARQYLNSEQQAVQGKAKFHNSRVLKAWNERMNEIQLENPGISWKEFRNSEDGYRMRGPGRPKSLDVPYGEKLAKGFWYSFDEKSGGMVAVFPPVIDTTSPSEKALKSVITQSITSVKGKLTNFVPGQDAKGRTRCTFAFSTIAQGISHRGLGLAVLRKTGALIIAWGIYRTSLGAPGKRKIEAFLNSVRVE